MNGRTGFPGSRFPPLAAFLVLLAAGCGAATVVDESRLVDLTHTFDEETVYWPTESGFRLERVHRGYQEDGGKWYAANRFSAPEHGGTHIDAPIHFAEGGWTTAEIPLPSLVGEARVIDVRKRCELDRDYLVSSIDILRHEEEWGTILPGTVVLVRTGFGEEFYPDAARYLGNDRGDVEDLHFPGLAQSAAALLVERGIDAVGIDTASIDHGPSRDFAAHRVLAGANIPVFENVANLDRVPPEGATVIALPMKIGDGTGGPLRIVALLP